MGAECTGTGSLGRTGAAADGGVLVGAAAASVPGEGWGRLDARDASYCGIQSCRECADSGGELERDEFAVVAVAVEQELVALGCLQVVEMGLLEEQEEAAAAGR